MDVFDLYGVLDCLHEADKDYWTGNSHQNDLVIFTGNYRPVGTAVLVNGDSMSQLKDLGFTYVPGQTETPTIVSFRELAVQSCFFLDVIQQPEGSPVQATLNNLAQCQLTQIDVAKIIAAQFSTSHPWLAGIFANRRMVASVHQCLTISDGHVSLATAVTLVPQARLAAVPNPPAFDSYQMLVSNSLSQAVIYHNPGDLELVRL